MRRRVAMVVSVLALGVGLVAWRAAPSEPPDVRVTSDGESIAVQRGSYCWRGTFSGRCVDTAGPPELVQGMEPVPVEPGAPVEFRFGREPSEVAVHLWPEGEPEEVPLTGARSFTAPLEPGTYVYSIFGRWDGRGDVTYAFTIRVEEP